MKCLEVAQRRRLAHRDAALARQSQIVSGLGLHSLQNVFLAPVDVQHPRARRLESARRLEAKRGHSAIYGVLWCGLADDSIRLDLEEYGPALAALLVYGSPEGLFGSFIALAATKIDRASRDLD